MTGREVAIVGMGCRLPGGVSSPSQLVRFLRDRGDGVVDVPADRWNSDLFYHPDPTMPGKAYVKRAAFLQQNVFAFDPAPFGISPREADYLDPQQRLLLEVSWEAFEDAGIPIDALRGSNTAVFIGGFTLDQQSVAYARENQRLVSAHTSVGASLTLLSNRISYTFDLHGPSLTVDTACSSSLVAAHLGCEAVVRGDADLAIVGGVNVMLSPATFIAMCKGHFLAADGRSKTFDAGADGYGRGEGAAVVVLKSLEAARRDRDRIYAVIVASGVNQDGRTDGVPMPNEAAQRALCERVLAAADLQARDIAYVEAHGTGTRAGDPVETRALSAVYGRDRAEPLLVGSVKTNVGHLEAAAGVTGLMKAALSVKNREIFPLRTLGAVNPDIPFEELRLAPAISAQPWPTSETARASVNAFGYGGTNAHLIVGEAPEAPQEPNDVSDDGGHRVELVPISAASSAALAAGALELADAVTDDGFRDLLYTLSRRRAHHVERAVVLAASAGELRAELAVLGRGESSGRCVTGRALNETKLLWVFTGMGPQWWGMGQELYRTEPVFREHLELADRAFQAAAGWSVLAEMLRDETTSRMASNAVAQPANFVLQVALVGLLRRLGVPAHGLLGHSVGEVAAAWAAGCLSLEQAAFVAHHRSRLQQKVAGKGTMLAAAISPTEAHKFVDENGEVTIAAYNAPRSVALAGTRTELEKIEAALEARGVFARLMSVEVAYHSPQLAPLESEFLASLRSVSPRPPAATLYSTALGARVEGEVHDAAYWWENARAPVLLQQALELAILDGYTGFVEIGPHAVLGPAIREVLAHRGREGRTFACLNRREPEQNRFLRTIAELHVSAVPLDWSLISPIGKLCDLPKYPFQRDHHWTETNESRDRRTGRPSAAPFLSERDDGPTLRFTTDLLRPSLAYLSDHRIQGAIVFPGAGYVAALLSAAAEISNERSEHVLEDVVFERALVLSGQSAALLTDVDRKDGRCIVCARHGDGDWQPHARAHLVEGGRYEPLSPLPLSALEQRCDQEVSVQETYERLRRVGLEYGPAFRRLARLRMGSRQEGGGTVLVGLEPSKSLEHQLIDPAMLDAGIHALFALAPDLTEPLVPVSVDRVRWRPGGNVPALAVATMRSGASNGFVADVQLADSSGEVVMELRGLLCQRLATRASGEDLVVERLLHVDTWAPVGWTDHEFASTEHWVLAGDAPDLLPSLASALAASGAHVSEWDGETGAEPSAGAIVVFAARSSDDDPTGTHACGRLVQAVQALQHTHSALRVVTFGAHSLTRADLLRPDQAALWGLSRVVMTEHPELDCRVVDIEAGHSAPSNLSRMLARPSEEELAVRGGALFARRLRRLEAAPLVPTIVPVASYRGAYALSHAHREGLSAVFVPTSRSAPAAGEVEIAVIGASIRRADLTPGAHESTSLRSVVGVVVAVGEGVGAVNTGNSVHACTAGAISSHVVVAESRVTQLLPAHGLGAAIAYGDCFVAWHALVDLARVEPNERVLVYGADTALGAQCVAVARLTGAEVIVAADSPEEFPAVAHSYSSRTLDFVEQALRDSDGIGAHVVVSTRSDAPVAGLLSLLASGGRYLDLAERKDDDAHLSARLLRKGVTFTALDLLAFIDGRPNRYSRLTERVLGAFESGALVPVPRRVLSAVELAQLDGEPASGTRDASLAVDLSAGDGVVEVPSSTIEFKADRSYLVTGGLSGFGLATGAWLVERGARHIVLASRRGAPDGVAQGVIAKMQSAGAAVHCLELDVAEEWSVRRALDFVDRQLPPLAGVFHSAVVLDDGSIGTLGVQSLARVMQPKALGAWLLYEAVAARHLDFLVFYSSVSALIGNPNQASYAAANSFLDGLAALGRVHGRKVFSVSWGAIGDVGLVARSEGTEKHLRGLGIGPIPARTALAALERVLAADVAHACIVDMQWDHWVRNFPSTPWRRLSDLVGRERPESADGPLAKLRLELAELGDQEKRVKLRARIARLASSVLRVKDGGLDCGSALRNYGLDSLMAVELQVGLERELGIRVPTIQLLAGATVDALAERVIGECAAIPAVTIPAPPSAEPDGDLRAYLLSRICAQPPYFALHEIARKEEWIEAYATPLPPSEDESDVVSCAEAARHLAIIGSCAVSMASTIPGKVYYPVLRAHYPDLRSTLREADYESPRALERIRVRARCLGFDIMSSKATAETELEDVSGNLLLKMLIDYHVIPEADFKRLFAAHAEPTEEASGFDPYLSWGDLPPCEEHNGEYRVDLGVVTAESCLGHFVGYPALPVSTMTHYAVRLIAEAIRRATPSAGAPLIVQGGMATANSFVFANERVTLTASAIRRQEELQLWRCNVHGSGRLAASFELSVRAENRRFSGLRVARNRLDRTG